MYRDPRCVLVADTLAEAEAAIGWFAGRDIVAQVIEENTLGGLDGLNIFTGVGARGWEVWVDNPDVADRARQMLADDQAAKEATRQARTGTVDATCEECGRSATYPAAEQGTIQDCPHCGRMIDVPDPDEDWDVGQTEEGDEA
jgi:hypothetical protein